MFKKSLLCAFLATIFIGSANTADASLILVLWEAGGPEAVVIDNKFAGDTVGGWTATVDDANMTLGAAVYNQSFGSYSVANITAESKPALPGNEMDLGGVVSTRENDTANLFAISFDTDFSGSGNQFVTQTGGTNEGDFQGSSWMNTSNDDDISKYSGIATSPLFTPADSPFSWSDTTNVAHGSPFALGLQAELSFTTPGVTSFDVNLKQVSAVPEPTTVLIWSMMAGVGLVVRRRR